MQDNTFTTILYEHTISAAHRLEQHPGKCRNVHGHTYKIVFELSNYKYDSEKVDMVMDFGTVKDLICLWFDNSLDHAIILDRNDPITKTFENWTTKKYYINGRPTAENLANHFLKCINELVDNYPGVDCISVTVYESPGRCAKVTRLDYAV